MATVTDIAVKYGHETVADASGFDDLQAEFAALSKDLDSIARRAQLLRGKALRFDKTKFGVREQDIVRKIVSDTLAIYKRAKGQ